jgi:hypothetical protein
MSVQKASRLAELRKRYPSSALETDLRLQKEFFLRLVDELDQLDQGWTESWLSWIYGYLYNRGILDDKTRILVVIGECCVLDQQVQLPNHIMSALRADATFRGDPGGGAAVRNLCGNAADDQSYADVQVADARHGPPRSQRAPFSRRRATALTEKRE